MESQNARIKAYLQSGKSLTALDGLHLFNCFRLGARIHDLKNEGMNIESQLIEITSDGRKKHISRYKLIRS